MSSQLFQTPMNSRDEFVLRNNQADIDSDEDGVDVISQELNDDPSVGFGVPASQLKQELDHEDGDNDDDDESEDRIEAVMDNDEDQEDDSK